MQIKAYMGVCGKTEDERISFLEKKNGEGHEIHFSAVFFLWNHHDSIKKKNLGNMRHPTLQRKEQRFSGNLAVFGGFNEP